MMVREAVRNDAYRVSFGKILFPYIIMRFFLRGSPYRPSFPLMGYRAKAARWWASARLDDARTVADCRDGHQRSADAVDIEKARGQKPDELSR